MNRLAPFLLTALLAGTLLLMGCDETSATGGATGSPPAGSPTGSAVAGSPAAGTPGVTGTPGSSGQEPGVVGIQGLIEQEIPRTAGGSQNTVTGMNTNDRRFRAVGRIEFNRIYSDKVNPGNYARAEAQCTNCQTIAVAVQVNVYQRGASEVSPANVAVAVNTQCSRCVTVARAIQYVIPVDDPKVVPGEVDALVRDINQQMHYFETLRTADQATSEAASQQLTAILQKYGTLLQYLRDTQDVDESETRTVTPTPSVSATPSPTGSPSATASATGTVSPTSTASVGPTGSTPATVSPTSSATLAAGPSASATSSVIATPSGTATVMPTTGATGTTAATETTAGGTQTVVASPTP